jgi:hypothetical protein
LALNIAALSAQVGCRVASYETVIVAIVARTAIFFFNSIIANFCFKNSNDKISVYDL